MFSNSNKPQKFCFEAFEQYLKIHLDHDICKAISTELKLNFIFTESQDHEVTNALPLQSVEIFLKYILCVIDQPNCYEIVTNCLKSLGFGYVVDTLEGRNKEKLIIQNLWKKALGDSYGKFLANFDSSPILERHGHRLFNEHSVELIQNEMTTLGKTRAFLFHLTKQPDWFTRFVDVLNDPVCGNYSHWAKILDPEGNGQDAHFISLVELFLPKIKEVLDVDDVLSQMKTIPESSKKNIRSMPIKIQVEKFVDIMTSQKPGWFKEFVSALASYGKKYEELVELLEPNSAIKSSSAVENVAASTESSTNIIEAHGSGGEKDLNSSPTSDQPTEAEPSTDDSHEDTQRGNATDGDADVSALNISESEKFELEDSEKSGRKEDDLVLRDYQLELAEPALRGNNSMIVAPTDQPTEAEPSTDDSHEDTQRGNATDGDADVSALNISESEKFELEDSEKSGRKEDDLVLRDYQLELAEPALRGNNSMIVAPTGTGKTFVALKVCLEHMEEHSKPKVIFLVPRVPLVKQQYNLFKKYIKDEEKIFQVTGDTSSSVPVHKSIHQHVITFMTAQILVNLLRDGLMDISDISLLIFDECHHTVKKEPYNQIMGIYLDKRLQDQSCSLPQVLGLTASPGLGKAKKMSQALDNILSLMANLDVNTPPVQVNTQVGDLKKFQTNAKDEVVVVSRPTADAFVMGIKKAMQIIEKKIQDDIAKHQNELDGRIQYDLRASPGTQDYEAWAVTLLNKSKLIKAKMESVSQNFMACALHLREYNNCLILWDHARSIDAKKYIDETLFDVQPRNIIEREMRDIYEKIDLPVSDDTNPLLNQLTYKLCTEFSNTPQSRCIIFVKTREIARALLQYLTEHVRLKDYNLNPKQLTGAAARGENFGMTKVGQDDNLNAFRDGKCKVLVATSVAEEGLDIKECNLIITYNYSTNEVGKVQRKGRGRAEQSKVIMLAYDDSGHVKRERENAIRVELIQEILSEIRGMKKKELQEKIVKIQKKLQKERDIEKTAEAYKSKRKRPNAGPFKLQCIWCKRLVTSSDKFRHINKQHRVVVDTQFDNRAQFKQVPESEEQECGDEQFVIGKIFCKNKQCSREWGLRMRYKTVPISVLRIENFLITNEAGYRAVKKKWKETPFVVDRELDLRELLNDPEEQSSDDDVPEDDRSLGAKMKFD